MRAYKGTDQQAAAPSDVCEIINDAEGRIRPLEPVWQECLAFFDNEHYVEQNALTGDLQRVERREGGGKPRHRHRRTRNRYTPAMMREVALCSSRVPVYECDPLNGDPTNTGEARLEEKVLLGAYQQLGVKSVACRTMTYALNVGAGFTWAYWNPNRGKFLTVDGGKWLREGEISIEVLQQSEVLWDEGNFADSPWYCVRRAYPVRRVTSHPDYTGPKDLKPDAQSAPFESRKGEERKNLVYVYHYMERPSRTSRDGRYFVICQGQLIRKPDKYPYQDVDGTVIDEPVLQALPFLEREHRDRPMGLGEMAVEPQRDINRSVSQLLTHRDLALMPQWKAPRGSMLQKRDTTPGAVWEYRPIAGMGPEPLPIQEIPASAFRVLDQAIADMAEIVGQTPMGAVESGAEVQALNERDQDRRALFVTNLSQWYAALGERLLTLMRCHYTEERLMIVRGRFGAESIRAFKGSKLRPVKVRVAEGSVMPRTREAQRALIVQLIDRGLVDPRLAISALNAGTLEAITDPYELDVAKQNREIQQLVAMGQMRGAGVPMVDDEADDHDVHMAVLAMWMKTEDFQMMHPMVQEAARTHFQWHEEASLAKKLQNQMIQGGQAQALGAQNAARPQGPAGGPDNMPSQPSVKTSAEGAQMVSA